MNEYGFDMMLETPSAGVGLIRFKDEGRQNQLCWAAVSQLADYLDECVSRDLSVVVLASDNPGHWLEHAWLGDLCAGMEGKPTTGEGLGWVRCVNALSKPPLVSIAAISGNTCGGGCEIGWSCDLRVAEQTALFAQPEVRLGITPGMGGVARLEKLVGRTLASEMVLSGEWVESERLYRAGAINKLVGPGEALDVSLAWASEIAAMPAATLHYCKQSLADVQELHLQPSLIKEQETFQLSAVDALQRMKQQQTFYDAGGTTAESFQSESIQKN